MSRWLSKSVSKSFKTDHRTFLPRQLCTNFYAADEGIRGRHLLQSVLIDSATDLLNANSPLRNNIRSNEPLQQNTDTIHAGGVTLIKAGSGNLILSGRAFSPQGYCSRCPEKKRGTRNDDENGGKVIGRWVSYCQKLGSEDSGEVKKL